MANTIIFFDGVCALCNRFVGFVYRRDKAHEFKFAPLQGETARKVLPDLTERIQLSSVVLFDNGRIVMGSSAALEILSKLGGLWRFVIVLKLVPRFLRDLIYGWVANNRYRWFGQSSQCRWTSEEWQGEYFLD